MPIADVGSQLRFDTLDGGWTNPLARSIMKNAARKSDAIFKL